jgi:hypothetical protein
MQVTTLAQRTHLLATHDPNHEIIRADNPFIYIRPQHNNLMLQHYVPRIMGDRHPNLSVARGSVSVDVTNK